MRPEELLDFPMPLGSQCEDELPGFPVRLGSQCGSLLGFRMQLGNQLDGVVRLVLKLKGSARAATAPGPIQKDLATVAALAGNSPKADQEAGVGYLKTSQSTLGS